MRKGNTNNTNNANKATGNNTNRNNNNAAPKKTTFSKRPPSSTTLSIDGFDSKGRTTNRKATHDADDDDDDFDLQDLDDAEGLNNNNQNNKKKRNNIKGNPLDKLKPAPVVNYEAYHDNAIQDMPLPSQQNPNKVKRTDVRILRERIRDMRDRFQDVSDSLKCGICGSIFLDPVQIVHVDCNHIYCERCLELRTVDESACPECGFRFTQNLVKPASAINNIILDQLVPCFYEPAGCTDRIKFRELDDHEKRCNYNPDREIECICGKEMSVSKHQSHLANECPEFSFDCPHGCGEKVKRKYLQRHEDYDCILKPVRCEFAGFGCAFKGPRADLLKHNKDTFQKHMAMMAGRIQDLESETKKMHLTQREQSQRHAEQDYNQRAARGDSFGRSMQTLMPGPGTSEFHDLPINDSRVKPRSGGGTLGLRASGGEGGGLLINEPIPIGASGPNYSIAKKSPAMVSAPSADAMFGGGPGGSDRVLPAGLSQMNDLVRPKWDRQSLPKRVIESPRDGSYKFVRPFCVAFVNNETLVMADCKTTWLIDVETGAIRNTLDPLSVKERQLYRPRGVAVQEMGLRVYVADSQADCVHVFSPWGEYSTSFGKGKLKYPQGITTFRNRVYVCDTHHQTMQIFDSVGTHVGNLVDDYHGSPLQACCSDLTGLVYVTMNSTSDSYVLVIDYLGEFVTTFGVKGNDIGMLTSARGIAVDQNENVIVSNSNSYKVQMFGKIPTKLSLRESRRWENKVREQLWQEEMDSRDREDRDLQKDFEQKVQDRLKKRPTEVTMPKYEYRVVNWLGGDLSAPHGMAISPNKQMLAVVDEVKNKLYIY